MGNFTYWICWLRSQRGGPLHVIGCYEAVALTTPEYSPLSGPCTWSPLYEDTPKHQMSETINVECFWLSSKISTDVRVDLRTGDSRTSQLSEVVQRMSDWVFDSAFSRACNQETFCLHPPQLTIALERLCDSFVASFSFPSVCGAKNYARSSHSQREYVTRALSIIWCRVDPSFDALHTHYSILPTCMMTCFITLRGSLTPSLSYKLQPDIT